MATKKSTTNESSRLSKKNSKPNGRHTEAKKDTSSRGNNKLRKDKGRYSN